VKVLTLIMTLPSVGLAGPRALRSAVPPASACCIPAGAVFPNAGSVQPDLAGMAARLGVVGHTIPFRHAARCDRVCAVDVAYDRDGGYLGRLADVFGDPTRRRVYRHLRAAAAPLTASEVAAEFGLHRTVARAHLEKLTEMGLAEAGTRRRSGGGRPAKTYELSDERLEVMLPPRRYERLSRLLLRLVARSLDSAAAAEAAFDMGHAFGAETAAEIAGADVQPPVRLAPHAVVAWMDAAGYDVTLDDGAKGVMAVEVRNCVYRELAEEFPDIVCPFDRGTLCGMLGVDASAHRQTHSLGAGDGYCRHEFRL
jgi:predicted ArsR family transcriptional regulator